MHQTIGSTLDMSASTNPVNEVEVTQILKMVTAMSSGDVGFCLYPGCDNTPVKNHSISKKISLGHLNHKGKVLAPYRLPKTLAGPPLNPTMRFELVGVNEASAFKGLCHQHDNKLWEELDNISYMDLPSYQPPGTSKWIRVDKADDLTSKFAFLLLYRSVMHAASVKILLLRAYLQREFDMFSSLSDLVDPFSGEVLAAMMTLRYKLRLDELYARQQWDSVVQLGVRIGPCEKTWAYSQFIFLDDQTPLHPVGASFTLLPGVGECLIACVTFREYSEELDGYLGRNWLTPDHHMFRASVSKMALQDSDNIYIHPRFWRSLGPERQRKIQEFWVQTRLWGGVPYYVHEDLNLFNPPSGGVKPDE